MFYVRDEEISVWQVLSHVYHMGSPFGAPAVRASYGRWKYLRIQPYTGINQSFLTARSNLQAISNALRKGVTRIYSARARWWNIHGTPLVYGTKAILLIRKS